MKGSFAILQHDIFTTMLSISKYKFHFLLWLTMLTAFIVDTTWMMQEKPDEYLWYLPLKISLQMGIVYFNIAFLIPRFYNVNSKRKYYWWLVVLLFIVVGFLNNILELSLWRKFNTIDPTNMLRYILINFQLPLRFLIFSAILQKTVDFYWQQDHIKKVELEKVKAEMDLLKAQVNPHFLLNTMNNLYALSMENPAKTSESILMLADILKYMLHVGSQEKVPLKQEIALLSNYIELEKLRSLNGNIQFEINGDTALISVPPLLLIPFVENAFKYGFSTVSKNAFVEIKISCNQTNLQMTVENNNPPADDVNAVASHGIGLANVQKRLALLYPQKHILISEKRDASFYVSLNVYTHEI